MVEIAKTSELFKVAKVQLAPVTLEGEHKIAVPTEQALPLSYGMYRMDTGAWLGTVGPQYVPVQNQDLFDVVAEAADLAGLNHEDVSFLTLQGGRKVSFQVALPDWNLTGDDAVKRYVTALNSHDGSSSLGMGLVGTRVWCNNTWVQAYKAVNKFRHSASIHDNIRVMSAEFKRVISTDKQLFDVFAQMQQVEYNEVGYDHFVKELFGYDLADLEKLDINTTQRENNIRDLVKSIDIEVEHAGRNMWGVFNGVTRYVNHERAVRSDDPDGYIYFGGGKKLVDKALEILEFQIS